jgi:hypothetical protein
METQKNPIATNGATWNAYYADKAAWPEGSYHDDTEIIVEGRAGFEDLSNVPNEASVIIKGGIVVLSEYDSLGLCEHFTTWRENQTFSFGTFKVPKKDLDEVVAAIVSAGGSVL